MDPTDETSRLRIKIACDECRRGKRKCDGRKPTCTLCAKSDRVCHYAPEESRKRKGRDEDLIQSLQEEIVALRATLGLKNGATGATEIDESRPVQAAEIQPLHLSEVSLLAYPDQATPSSEEQALEIRSPQAMNELSSLMLQLDIADIGEPSFTIASGTAPQKDIQDHHKTSSLPPSRSQPFDIHDVSNEDREHLVQCFSDRFNRFHQFLNVDEAASLSRPSLDHEEIDVQFRNAALFAVATSYSGIPRLTSLTKHFTESAENLVLRCIKERTSDFVVQGLALLAWTELMFGSESMAYTYIAMATGQVLHLGIHASALKSSNLPEGQDQDLYKRRVRSFWAYFSVDRLVTSSLGMNCTMHWQRVKAQPFTSILPTVPTVDEWSHERFCELWHLWDSYMDQGHVAATLHTQTDALTNRSYAFGWSKMSPSQREGLVLRSHEALTKFFRGNDTSLHLRKDHMPDTAVWLQLSYHAGLILIHRPLLGESSDGTLCKFSLRVATTSAASISRIVREYKRTQVLTSIAPQIIDYISTAAIVHLLNATSGRNRLGRQSANGIRTCIEALSDMTNKWGKRARNSIQRIQDLAYRWEVVWALPIQYTQPLQNPQPTSISNEPVQVVGLDKYAAMSGYSIFDDAALDMAAERLWDPNETLMDQDYILNAVEGVETNNADLWNLGWLFGSEKDGLWSSFPT